jgi:hypothetical protein
MPFLQPLIRSRVAITAPNACSQPRDRYFAATVLQPLRSAPLERLPARPLSPPIPHLPPLPFDWLTPLCGVNGMSISY